MAEDNGELFDVLNGCLADSKDRIFQPVHTDGLKSIAEELFAKLFGEDWELFDDA